MNQLATKHGVVATNIHDADPNNHHLQKLQKLYNRHDRLVREMNVLAQKSGTLDLTGGTG